MTNQNLFHNVINWTEVDPHKMTLSMRGKSQRFCVIVFALWFMHEQDSALKKLSPWLIRWTAPSGGNTALATRVSAGSNRWNAHITGSILTLSCEAVATVCQLQRGRAIPSEISRNSFQAWSFCRALVDQWYSKDLSQTYSRSHRDQSLQHVLGYCGELLRTAWVLWAHCTYFWLESHWALGCSSCGS